MNLESNITIEEYDEIFFLSKRDYIDEFEVSITGGVRLPNTFSFGEGLNLSVFIKQGKIHWSWYHIDTGSPHTFFNH